MNLIKYLVLGIALLTRFSVYAYEPCRDLQVLWQMDDNTRIPDTVTVSNGTDAEYFDIVLPALPSKAPGSVASVERNNVPWTNEKIPSGKGKKNLTTWIAIPASTRKFNLGNGLIGSAEIISGDYTPRSIYNGYQTYSGKYISKDWTGFFPTTLYFGYTSSSVENAFGDTKIRVYIEKGSAFAGTYNIKIPVKVGSEEWYKGEVACSGGVGIEYSVATMYERFAPVKVDVLASCKLNDSRDLIINHGSLTAAQARAGNTSSTFLGIHCNSPSIVNVTMKGLQPVSGEPSNVTMCGANGKCTLKVDGVSNFKDTVDGTKNFEISSTYNVIDPSKPYTGAFNGTAVVNILMQ